MTSAQLRSLSRDDDPANAIDPRDRLIVGLDLPSVEQAEAMVARLGETVTFYKIGMELTYAGGLSLAERLVGEGKGVFMDLKLHDIPNTVERATRQIARRGTGSKVGAISTSTCATSRSRARRRARRRRSSSRRGTPAPCRVSRR